MNRWLHACKSLYTRLEMKEHHLALTCTVARRATRSTISAKPRTGCTSRQMLFHSSSPLTETQRNRKMWSKSASPAPSDGRCTVGAAVGLGGPVHRSGTGKSSVRRNMFISWVERERRGRSRREDVREPARTRSHTLAHTHTHKHTT